MHATEREQKILELMRGKNFLSFRAIEASLEASPATIRRDLERLAEGGWIDRVRGGARPKAGPPSTANAQAAPDIHLQGTPFHDSIERYQAEKRAIGRAAAALCAPGEGVMIDGGTTTLQMCPHIGDLNLQVLTNSLPIVSALLPQPNTRILLPSGNVFREQNIILAVAGEESMPRFHAPKLFMGAASVGVQGIMQADVILVAAERRLMEKADELILLVDSSKFNGPSGIVVCGLEEIDVVVTDKGIRDQDRKMLDQAGVRLVIAD